MQVQRVLIKSLILAGMTAAVAPALSFADAGKVTVTVCRGAGVCQKVLVDRAEANLYKTDTDGSIVINSTVVETDPEAQAAMRACGALKSRYESVARSGEQYSCKLEPL
jgi:hypothetical protein